MRITASVVALLALAGAAHAGTVQLSEFFVNPPGTDNGQEFFELCGDAGESLSGLKLIVIEGDGSGAGSIDAILDLGSFSLGSNGLFLWRDSSSVIDTSPTAGVQGPDAGTNINVADFSPDIENGSNTYLLVRGFSGALSADLDTDNDGILDVTPWTSVVDGVSIVENDGAANIGYAAGLGFSNIGGIAFTFTPDIVARGTDGVWYGADVLGTNPGGFYAFDATQNTIGPGAENFGATPGVKNTVPAPGAMALLSLGGLMVARRRRA